MRHLVFIIVLLASCVAASAQKELNIVYIGNSITYGALHKDRDRTAPPAVCSKWLEGQQGIGKVYFANCGRSGRTTFNFVPIKGDKNQNYFPMVVKETAKLVKGHPKAKLVFSIMLGTNDAAERPFNSITTPYKYHENISLIIDSLSARWPGAIFVLHKPIYHSVPFTTKNGSYMSDNSVKLYGEYYKSCRPLAKSYPDKIFMGDKDAYDYFKKNYKTQLFHEHGRDNCDFWLHPTVEGATVLAHYWGKAILKALQ